MNVKSLRTLCIEIFKTLNNLNPIFMKEIFSLRQANRPAREKYKLNLDILSHNQVTFARKVLTFFRRKNLEQSSLSYKIYRKSFGTENCKNCCKNYFYYYYFFLIFPIKLAGNFCSEIQGYQMTDACVDPEVKQGNQGGQGEIG